jgi:hypothetical protein
MQRCWAHGEWLHVHAGFGHLFARRSVLAR